MPLWKSERFLNVASGKGIALVTHDSVLYYWDLSGNGHLNMNLPKKPHFQEATYFKPDVEVCSRGEFEKFYESLFKDAVEVECYLLKESNLTDEHGPGWTAAEPRTRIIKPESTHKALLINVRPIKEETAEDLLRELADLVIPQHCSNEVLAAYNKARKFLEKK